MGREINPRLKRPDSNQGVLELSNCASERNPMVSVEVRSCNPKSVKQKRRRFGGILRMSRQIRRENRLVPAGARYGELSALQSIGGCRWRFILE